MSSRHHDNSGRNQSQTTVSGDDARAKQLGEVFNKVTEASVNSISEVDLSSSFNVVCGDGKSLKDIYGSNLQKLFFNFVAKSQGNIISTFQDIYIRHSVDDLLAHIDSVNLEEEELRRRKAEQIHQLVSQRVSNFDSETSRKALLADVKRMEWHMILSEMAALDAEVRRLQEASIQLKSQVVSELSAVNEEFKTRYSLDSA